VEDLTQFLENMAFAVSVSESLLTKVKSLELKNQAGNIGGKRKWLMIQSQICSLESEMLKQQDM
jgi:hypothetical protein